MESNQTADLLEILINLNASKIAYTVPTKWSVNKLKCLLCSEIPSLNFDDFELSHCGQLLRGNHKIYEIQYSSNKELKRFPIDIIRTKSQICFQDYYSRTMKKYMKGVEYENQPILSTCYQKYKSAVSSDRENQNLEMEDAVMAQALQEENNPENQLIPLFRFLQYVGIYFMIVLVFQSAKFYQVGVIIGVIILFYLLEFYRKYHQRRMLIANSRRQNAEQPKPQTRSDEDMEEGEKHERSYLKGLVCMYSFKLIEIVYTFLFTIFPNLDIHIYLDTNAERLARAREQVNRFLPNAYPHLNPIVLQEPVQRDRNQ